MKTIAPKVIMLCSMFLFFFTSCEDNGTSDTETNYSEVDNTRAAKADNAIEGTLNIMEQAFEENEGLSRSNSSSLFPDCTIITIILNGNTGIIILDFGDSCQLNNGNIVSGKIILEFGAFIGGTRTINYTFENYYYNNNGVEGGGEIFREIANLNGNPQSTVNETILVSFPNTEVTATRVGLRVAEWVEGVRSGTWQDNVYNITGNWNTTFTNGFHRSGNVTEKLVRKLSCAYIVSGVIELEQEGFIGELDFGDGTCDNVAILTINGQEILIYL